MKYLKCLSLMILICWELASCQSHTKPTAMEELPVLFKTADGVTYLTSLWRNNQRTPNYMPAPGADEFYLEVGTWTTSGENDKYASSSSYTIRVTGYPENTRMKLRMESDTFYEDGVNVGHASPTFKWVDDDEFCQQVLSYYEAHKEEVNIWVDTLDVTSFNPLHLLSDDNSALRYILSLTPVDTIGLYGNGDFCVEFQTLYAHKVVNYKNEMQSYSIAKSWLHFIPSENRYWLRVKSFPTRSYYEGDKMEEVQPQTSDWQTYDEMPDCYIRILDYYLDKSRLQDARKKIIFKYLITEVQSYLKGGRVLCSYTDNQGDVSHFEGKFKRFADPDQEPGKGKEYALVPVQFISEVTTGTQGSFYLVDTEKPMGLVTKEGDTRIWVDGGALVEMDFPDTLKSE